MPPVSFPLVLVLTLWAPDSVKFMTLVIIMRGYDDGHGTMMITDISMKRMMMMIIILAISIKPTSM